MVSKGHPIQNFFEIYNPDMSDNLWNIYDIMNKSPYEAVIEFCNLCKDNLTLFCTLHIALEKQNPKSSYLTKIYKLYLYIIT